MGYAERRRRALWGLLWVAPWRVRGKLLLAWWREPSPVLSRFRGHFWAWVGRQGRCPAPPPVVPIRKLDAAFCRKMARQIQSWQQFDAIVASAKPALRAAVRARLLPLVTHLPKR